jgi:hypothetical protein
MIGRGNFRPWALAITPGHSQSPLCLLSGPLVELSWIIVSRINLVSSHGEHAQLCCEVEYTPMSYTSMRCTPMSYTPMRYTPIRCMPITCTPMRCTPMRYTPVRYTP